MKSEKTLRKEYLESAVEENITRIIHIEFQNLWFLSKEGVNSKGLEFASNVINQNNAQIKELKDQLAFFEKLLKTA